jgi:ribonuclease HI
MGRTVPRNPRGDLSLPEVLRRLARGESLGRVAKDLGRTPYEVSEALEGLARCLGGASVTAAPSAAAVLRCDGAARGNPGPAGIGWMIEAGGESIAEGRRFLGTATNNVAEYEAAIDAVEKAREMGLRGIRLELDSELVVRQLTGDYRVRDPKLLVLHDHLRRLFGTFANVSVGHVPRTENRRADELANLAIDEAAPAEARKLPSPGPSPGTTTHNRRSRSGDRGRS